MRSLIFTLLSLFVIAFASQASAESRYCAGSCDRYGNPIPESRVGEPIYLNPDGTEAGRPNLRNDYLYPPGYRPAPRYRRIVRHRRYKHRSHRRYRKVRRYNGHRHQRKVRRHHRHYREHRSHRRYARPTFHNRTKYCRDEVRWIGHGQGIRRCVWVRNDLIHRYEGRGYYRH